jgi:squalene-hopene/tetraprenyl-beta-curcumene cyclase
MRTSTALLALAVVAGACDGRRAAAAEAKAPLVCDGAAPTGAGAHPPPGNPEARRSAQKGLGYLARASEKWTQEHKCFGCHVQAVTVEAMTVARHHQYEVGASDLGAMVAALRLGVTAGGRTTGAAFEGQAWARYDAFIDAKGTDHLMKYAAELAGLQQEDGSIPDDDARLPVTGGTLHTTYQAMQTWRQAYARTADGKWLTPLRRAEHYLAARSESYTTGEARKTEYLQNVNFALLGLVAAGVGPGETSSRRLQELLLSRQNQDGGWGLEPGQSDGLATGQTLYALRLASHGDGEAAIDRGTAWLIKHQGDDGAWRTVHSGQGGAEKGEGMWAVLGLVSIDVTSVTVAGVVDGQHVVPTMQLSVDAKDNLAGGVKMLELVVDDRPLTASCGAHLATTWKTDGLGDGRHTLDVVATNGRGQVTRRRFDVYAGNAYLTDVGARFDEANQATEIALRDLAARGQVGLNVYATDGAGARGARVYTSEQAGAPGPLTFRWDGNGQGGKPAPRGRYVAEVVLYDDRHQVVQRAETLFLRDSEEAQRARYGEIEGQLQLDGGAGVSANTVVELVDKAGRVVQRAQSTEQGNYRFKNVDGGEYKVRTQKAGWAAQEATVTAAPASAPAKADLKMH